MNYACSGDNGGIRLAHYLILLSFAVMGQVGRYIYLPSIIGLVLNMYSSISRNFMAALEIMGKSDLHITSKFT